MEPMETLFNPHARFIKISHVRSKNSRFDLRFNRFKGLVHAGISGQGGAFIKRTAPQITSELFDLLQLATANHYTQLMLRDFHAGCRNIKYLTLLRYI